MPHSGLTSFTDSKTISPLFPLLSSLRTRIGPAAAAAAAPPSAFDIFRNEGGLVRTARLLFRRARRLSGGPPTPATKRDWRSVENLEFPLFPRIPLCVLEHKKSGDLSAPPSSVVFDLIFSAGRRSNQTWTLFLPLPPLAGHLQSQLTRGAPDKRGGGVHSLR